MQKNWRTELADRLQGETTEDKAILDISRAVRENLYHESIGVWITATPKNLTGDTSFLKTGSVAVDRMKNLRWKDYDPIAKGEGTIIPHVGGVDTIQFPLDTKWYFSYQMEDTDLARLRYDGIYKAKIAAMTVQSLAASLDIELFDLLLAGALGGKRSQTVFERPFPKFVSWEKSNIYLEFTNIVNEMEQQLTEYNTGVNRSGIVVFVSPKAYSHIIREIPGSAMLIEKTLDWVQNEKIVASKISGVTIIRHPFLDNNCEVLKNPSYANLNFKGIHMIFTHQASAVLAVNFRKAKLGLDVSTGNDRYIEKIMFGKGLIYGDLTRIIKEPLEDGEAMPFEKHYTENSAKYNKSHAFKDLDIEIPNNIDDLRKKYKVLHLNENLPSDDEPNEQIPDGWTQRTFNERDVIFDNEKGTLLLNNQTFYRAGEDWANNENGIENLKNWFDFEKEFKNKKGVPIVFKKIVLWTTTTWSGYLYAVPIQWELKRAKIKKINKF